MEKHFAAILSLVCLAGCGGGGGEEPTLPGRPVRIDSMTFEMAVEANGRRPAKVGLVQVGNPSLVEQLLEIPAAEWFGDNGKRFRNAHPDAYYDDWELVPGFVTGPFDLSVDEYVSAILFCDTDAADPPLRIQDDGDLAVHIEPDGCEVFPIQ